MRLNFAMCLLNGVNCNYLIGSFNPGLKSTPGLLNPLKYFVLPPFKALYNSTCVLTPNTKPQVFWDVFITLIFSIFFDQLLSSATSEYTTVSSVICSFFTIPLIFFLRSSRSQLFFK